MVPRAPIPPRVLNSKLAACRKPAEVLRLVRTELNSMDPINLSTALHNVARTTNISDFNTRSNLGVLDLKPYQLKTERKYEIQKNASSDNVTVSSIPKYRNRKSSENINAKAALSERSSLSQQRVALFEHHLFRALRLKIIKLLAEATSQDASPRVLSSVAWSLGSLRLLDETLLSLLVYRALRFGIGKKTKLSKDNATKTNENFSYLDVMNICWCFSTLRSNINSSYIVRPGTLAEPEKGTPICLPSVTSHNFFSKEQSGAQHSGNEQFSRKKKVATKLGPQVWSNLSDGSHSTVDMLSSTIKSSSCAAMLDLEAGLGVTSTSTPWIQNLKKSELVDTALVNLSVSNANVALLVKHRAVLHAKDRQEKPFDSSTTSNTSRNEKLKHEDFQGITLLQTYASDTDKAIKQSRALTKLSNLANSIFIHFASQLTCQTLRNFDPPALSILAWSFSKTPNSPLKVNVLQQIASLAALRFSSFNSHQLCNLMWAFLSNDIPAKDFLNLIKDEILYVFSWYDTVFASDTKENSSGKKSGNDEVGQTQYEIKNEFYRPDLLHQEVTSRLVKMKECYNKDSITNRGDVQLSSVYSKASRPCGSNLNTCNVVANRNATGEFDLSLSRGLTRSPKGRTVFSASHTFPDICNMILGLSLCRKIDEHLCCILLKGFLRNSFAYSEPEDGPDVRKLSLKELSYLCNSLNLLSLASLPAFNGLFGEFFQNSPNESPDRKFLQFGKEQIYSLFFPFPMKDCENMSSPLKKPIMPRKFFSEWSDTEIPAAASQGESHSTTNSALGMSIKPSENVFKSSISGLPTACQASGTAAEKYGIAECHLASFISPAKEAVDRAESSSLEIIFPLHVRELNYPVESDLQEANLAYDMSKKVKVPAHEQAVSQLDFFLREIQKIDEQYYGKAVSPSRCCASKIVVLIAKFHSLVCSELKRRLETASQNNENACKFLKATSFVDVCRIFNSLSLSITGQSELEATLSSFACLLSSVQNPTVFTQWLRQGYGSRSIGIEDATAVFEPQQTPHNESIRLNTQLAKDCNKNMKSADSCCDSELNKNEQTENGVSYENLDSPKIKLGMQECYKSDGIAKKEEKLRFFPDFENPLFPDTISSLSEASDKEFKYAPKEGFPYASLKGVQKTSSDMLPGCHMLKDEPVEVLFKSNEYMVLFKPAFWVVNPFRNFKEETESHDEKKLAKKYRRKRSNSEDGDHRAAPRQEKFKSFASFLDEKFSDFGEADKKALHYGICHRLDAETSGPILIARSAKALILLRLLFECHAVGKEYLCLVHGAISKAPKSSSCYLFSRMSTNKNSETNSLISKEDPVSGQIALARYRCISWYKHKSGFADEIYSLCQIQIATGRTHQIRLQMANLGFPVVSDKKYSLGKRQLLKDLTWCPRHFLHCTALSFHDLPGDRTLQTFESPLPTDLKNVLETLEPCVN